MWSKTTHKNTHSHSPGCTFFLPEIKGGFCLVAFRAKHAWSGIKSHLAKKKHELAVRCGSLACDREWFSALFPLWVSRNLAAFFAKKAQYHIHLNVHRKEATGTWWSGRKSCYACARWQPWPQATSPLPCSSATCWWWKWASHPWGLLASQSGSGARSRDCLFSSGLTTTPECWWDEALWVSK